ncbi:glycosyltransferase [Mastigocoleus testarum]|uniref:Glycosyl transferase family 1 n=1 Tax=Mastigocoleus testarum BC008 TaxID=371196 RepID=A0A0V7ZEG2_9CYAN|nr:glycosyltransferase [Mastigocoleus testarum]KST62780.1 glycosyl transferase family 1 [Mastigocoleus testarum BC008]KST65127.1 glycosyl transferase family 1 [Mastigocoleus testarum BC008]
MNNTILKNSPDIAIFLRTLNGGGAERVCLNLAQFFLQQNLKVDMVLARAEGPLLKQLPPDIRLIDLQGQSKFSIPLKLAKYLRFEKPASLLAALHYPCEIAILAKHIARVSTRIIVSERNTISVEAKRIPRLSVRLTPFAARLFYPFADNIVAVSEGVAEDLANVTHLPRERIDLIYNPVLTSETFIRAKEAVHHPWFQPGEPPVILAVGRLKPQKDYPTLLRAFALVRKMRRCRLVILGDGSEKYNLKNLISELGLEKDVYMEGFVDNPYAYMSKANAFVLSSLWEGLGNVLIEAMACGCPVISTDCPSGPKEILAGGKYGELTPVGDPKAMAEAILKVLSGNTKQIDSDWLNQFTLEYSAEKYLKVLGIN